MTLTLNTRTDPDWPHDWRNGYNARDKGARKSAALRVRKCPIREGHRWDGE
jgi:hypothetical protein